VGEDWIDRLAAGGKWTGFGLLAVMSYRYFTFICNFLAGRFDARQARLEAREERIAYSLGRRLDHLERTEQENQRRIRLLEEVVAILSSELRQADPMNPKLKEIGKMMRDVHPVVPPDPQLEELMRHAARGIDQGEDGA
jgi:hypothetical protein